MDVPNVNVGSVDTPQTTTVNMKGRMQEEISQEETSPKLNEDPKEALTDPMETVGRSMVNFKGINNLSAKDLNAIAGNIAKTKANPEEISLLKKALVQTMNQYNKSNLENLKKYCLKSEDNIVDVGNSFLQNVTKIDPKADLLRLGDLFIAVI